MVEGSQEFEFVGSVRSLSEAMEMVAQRHPRLMILDKAFGIQPLVEWHARLLEMQLSVAYNCLGRDGQRGRGASFLSGRRPGNSAKNSRSRNVSCLSNGGQPGKYMDGRRGFPGSRPA